MNQGYEYFQKYYKYLHKNMIGENSDLLTNYFFVSSHNTYLPGNQLTSNSAYYIYFAILNKFGGGCMEIDPVEITKNRDDVKIYHSGTPTGKIKLGILLKLIVMWLKDPDNKDKITGPILLTFDNKTIKKRRDHDIIWNIFNDILFREENRDIVVWYDDNINKKDIKDLVGKIIFRWDKCTHNQNGVSSTEFPTHPDDICHTKKKNKLEPSKGLFPYCDGECATEWLNIIKPKISLFKPQDPLDGIQMQTIKQGDDEIKSKELYPKLINNTTKDILRVYPDPLKISSGNYNPSRFFANGAQCVALNFQNYGLYLSMYFAFFGNKTLVPKPSWLLTSNKNNALTKENIHRIYPPYYKVDVKVLSCSKHENGADINIPLSELSDLFNICTYDTVNDSTIKLENNQASIMSNITFPIICIMLKKKNISSSCDHLDKDNSIQSFKYELPIDIQNNFMNKTQNKNVELTLRKTTNKIICHHYYNGESEKDLSNIAECEKDVYEGIHYNDPIVTKFYQLIKKASYNTILNQNKHYNLKISYQLTKTNEYPVVME